MTNVELIGEAELKRCLNNLPYQLRRRIVISSLKTAALPMKQQAVTNAPKKTGITKKAMVIVDSKEDIPHVIIGPTQGKKVKNNAWYAKFQEFGTKGFGKRKSRASGVKINLKTGGVYTKRVTTAWAKKGLGLPAKEFMKRAFETKKDEVLNNTYTILNKKVVTYLRKTAPKYVR